MDDYDIVGPVPVVITPSRNQSATPPATSSQKTTTHQPKEGETVRDPSKRTEQNRDRREDPLAKRHKVGKDGMLPPPPNQAVVICGKLAHANVTEAEARDWSVGSLEANNEALTKLACEVFVRQTSRAKEIKSLAAANTKLFKDNQALRYKASAFEEEKKKIHETHRENVKLELGGLRTELREERAKVTSLEKSLEESKLHAEAEAKKFKDEIASLTAKLEAVNVGEESLKKEFTVLGQVKFMKSFIRKLPTFDWNLLGAATAGYAEDLKAEMAEEAAKRAQEAEEARLAEETRLAEEAKLAREANQDT